jgi:tetratricopeptide (TPR) repeat protein
MMPMLVIPLRFGYQRKITSFGGPCQTDGSAQDGRDRIDPDPGARSDPARGKRRSGIALVLLVALLLVSPWSVAAQSSQSLLKEGEDLYLNNKPDQAVAVLKSALEEEPRNARIYHYLGVSYQQLGMHEAAIETMREALDLSMSSRMEASFYFNIGNSYAESGQPQKAQEMYGKAVKADNSFAKAYLNRANTTVDAFKGNADKEQRIEAFERAVNDYQVYLSLKPQASQKPQIRKMIELLQQSAEQERQALEAERERRRREEERRKALVDSVLDSLDQAGEEAKSMSGGKEEIEEYEDDIDIAD